MFEFLRKRKEKREELERAKELNLISEEEFLELNVKRAEKKLKAFQGKDKKK